MRRRILGLMALVVLAAGPPRADARTATEANVDCAEYCAEKAVKKCFDLTSNWCNAYIIGCLAGCGISHL